MYDHVDSYICIIMLCNKKVGVGRIERGMRNDVERPKTGKDVHSSVAPTFMMYVSVCHCSAELSGPEEL